ncbi:hypothetical protein D9613_007956 [Agrocybe pediades]|uniref:Uncharacterized protein n=1 Tax=Agrocybe pediades TaxID=84607 RepID=A0A8H4QNU1_9AGAR|nr:hypothetical protein D9613_007956 [Agrocybe pediades]
MFKSIALVYFFFQYVSQLPNLPAGCSSLITTSAPEWSASLSVMRVMTDVVLVLFWYAGTTGASSIDDCHGLLSSIQESAATSSRAPIALLTVFLASLACLPLFSLLSLDPERSCRQCRNRLLVAVRVVEPICAGRFQRKFGAELDDA